MRARARSRTLTAALASFALGVALRGWADGHPWAVLLLAIAGGVAVVAAVQLDHRETLRVRRGSRPDPIGLEPGWVDASRQQRNGKGGPSW